MKDLGSKFRAFGEGYTRGYTREMSSNSSSSSGGIGFFGLLTVVFVTLKLTHYIDWSWWWVLSPLWMSVLAAVFIIVSFIGIATWLDLNK